MKEPWLIAYSRVKFSQLECCGCWKENVIKLGCKFEPLSFNTCFEGTIKYFVANRKLVDANWF